MPIIAAGASSTISLPAGRTFSYTGAGSSGSVLVFGPGPAAGQPYALMSSGVLGPFGEDRTLYVSAAQAITYSTDGPVGEDGLTAAQQAAGATGVAGVTADGGVIPSVYTWALRPDASANTGAVIAVSDFADALFVSNGTRWLPVGGAVVVAQSGVAGAPITGTTSLVAQDLVTIPGGLIGPNGQVVVEALWSMTANVNSKTFRLQSSGGGIVFFNGTSTSANTAISCRAMFSNRGSESSQVAQTNTFTGLGTSSTPLISGTVNTANDVLIQAAAQLGVGTDTVTLERWTVVVRSF